MKMKLLILLTGLGLIAAASNASAYPLDDVYYGADDHSWGDVIGNKNYFDIFGASATRSGNSLTVTIDTNFAGRAGTVFTNLTVNDQGLGYGDLFLSPGWNPFGTGPHYLDDNAGNGTHWTYAFALDDPLSNVGGAGALYALALGVVGNNNPSALLSDAFMDGGTFRNGLAVAVDTTGLTAVGSGTWAVGGDFLSFTFDINGLNNFDPNHFGLHWTMYCGNDVIEGLDPTSVPEPNTNQSHPAGFEPARPGLRPPAQTHPRVRLTDRPDERTPLRRGSSNS